MPRRALPLLLFATACAHQPLPTAESPLDLERVVLYRNGIGYFERHGQIDRDVLRLKVRRDQVDDLLKSLTVIDRASGRAVSVSMPLDPQSWAHAALATLAPGQGSLAEVLDGLRGTVVALDTGTARIRGRIVMVERIVNEPDDERPIREPFGPGSQPELDHKITLLAGSELRVVRLSKVRSVTLADGDVAVQLHRRLDGSAGEGMFQQVDVEVRLAGARRHDLVVSYVVAAPIWKPTYRVVLPETGKGQGLLQGWAVVDNTSGEDWERVTISLTSGEPIAFRYDLHTPREIERADLTETGVRRRAAVAIGETTFDEDVEKDQKAAQAEAYGADAYDADVEEENERAGFARGGGAGLAKARKEAAPPRASAPSLRSGPASKPVPPPEPAIDVDALRRSTQASARSQAVAGLSRFDLAERVTVPNGSSTMVAIVNELVDAEQTFLYRPGGAGIGYDANPYRVVRFKNGSPFVLEPGPISIYAGGSFVGEGLSEVVGAGTSATIPFAVEPGILVSRASESSEGETRLLRIVRGVLEVESFARTKTTWTVKGQARAEGFTVLVRHPKAGWNYALTPRPEGTEDLADGYLIPVVVAQGQTEGRVEVIEQTPSRTTLGIWDWRAPALLEHLLVAGEVTPETRKLLEPVVTLRLEIGRIDTEIEGLAQQQAELDARAEETRENLEAIRRDPAASALRSKLTERLESFAREGAALGRRIVELSSKRLEKKIELEDRLQTLDFDATPGTPPAAK